MSFIAEHWKGDRGEFRSFWLGVRHGLFCAGCCWPLMLLMSAVACGNVDWMLVLGIVMGIEKNLPWGGKLSTPLGVVMLVAGVLVPMPAAPGCWEGGTTRCRSSMTDMASRQ